MGAHVCTPWPRLSRFGLLVCASLLLLVCSDHTPAVHDVAGQLAQTFTQGGQLFGYLLDGCMIRMGLDALQGQRGCCAADRRAVYLD